MDEQGPSLEPPNDAVILERAHSLANEAMHMVALQRRRIRSDEPEDEVFVFRRWADVQFLIISLWRLRAAALMATSAGSISATIKQAVGRFDEALPGLRRLRNVGEHIGEYARERGHDPDIGRHELQLAAFNGTDLKWLGVDLNVDGAVEAAESLYRAIADSKLYLPSDPG